MPGGDGEALRSLLPVLEPGTKQLGSSVGAEFELLRQTRQSSR